MYIYQKHFSHQVRGKVSLSALAQGALFSGCLVVVFLFSIPVFAEQLVVGWGDSLTEGLCTHGYNIPMQSQMAQAGRPSYHINCGVGGEISSTSLSRLRETLQCSAFTKSKGYCSDFKEKYVWAACDGWIWSRSGWYDSLNGKRPDFILIWTGANDAYQGLNFNTTIFNIREMIRLAREYKITPLVATLTPDSYIGQYYCNQGILGADNDAIRNLAVSENVVLADQCNAIPYWTNNHCGHSFHPNNLGDQTIAATWLNVMPNQSDFLTVLNGQLLLLLGK